MATFGFSAIVLVKNQQRALKWRPQKGTVRVCTSGLEIKKIQLKHDVCLSN